MPGSRACGESSVTTRPKHAPSAPSIPGSPSVRTAKSSCRGNTSTRIGPFGVKLYFAESVFSAFCASGIAYSRITGASAGSSFKMMSPSRISTNLSRLSRSASRL